MKLLAHVFCISLIPLVFCISAQAQNSGTRASARTSMDPPPQLPALSKPDTSGSVEFINYLSDLLTIRDLPQYLTDEAIATFAIQQISVEKTTWETLFHTGGQIDVVRPRGPMITFEWQKLIDQRPELAEGPLLDVFINTVPDWSFLKNERGWDPDSPSPPYVVVFLFSREKIEGRDPAFAAHDLVPVVRRQIEMATKKVPTHFFFTETLPRWQYDFAAKSIRFPDPSGATRLNLLMPLFDPETKKGYRPQLDALPAKARAMMDYGMAGGEPIYYRMMQHQLPDDVNPGRPLGGYTPPYAWKDAFRFLKIPEPTVIALDRQVQITGVPVDAARAEEVHKQGGLLSARVYFVVDHIGLQHPAKKGDNDTMVFGRLEKVEILTRSKEVLATFKSASFRVAHEVAAPAAGGGPAATAARPPSTPKGNETNAQRIKRLNQEQFDRIRVQQEKAMACAGRAASASRSTDANDPAYKHVYDSCMQER